MDADIGILCDCRFSVDRIVLALQLKLEFVHLHYVQQGENN